MTNTGKKAGNPVKTAQSAFEIIEYLQDAGSAGVSEIAGSVGLAKSTVHRHLATLYEMEYVAKEGDRYRIGLKFLKLGEDVRNRKELYRMGKPIVVEIAEKTEERANFMAEEHGRMVYIHRHTGKHAVKTSASIGYRVDIHATASGKVALAYMPDEEVQGIIERRGLPELTANTITDIDTLFEELEQIRKQGYSINDQESVDGLRAVAVPIKGPNDRALGALSVSGPTQRMPDERCREELPQLLLGFANEMEINLVHS